MTFAQAEAHQRKHGFDLRPYTKKELATGKVDFDAKPKKSKDEMNKTERDYSFILEARKRRGEIKEYRFQGITLRWRDPGTGELMRYTADFTVWRKTALIHETHPLFKEVGVILELHEIKGGWIKGKLERAVERFRHARTVHPMIHFEMHQKKGGSWQRIH